MNEQTKNVTLYDWIPFFGEISQKLVEIGRKPQPERDQAIEEMAKQIFTEGGKIFTLRPIDPFSLIYTLASKMD